MLALAELRWSTLSRAYGESSDIPRLLADAEGFHSIGEVIAELTPEATTPVLEALRNQ